MRVGAMERLVLLLWLSSPIFGAITNVRVPRSTATQAVLAYTAPDGGPCSLKVSESDDFGGGYAPVHDVDPALFEGSDLDSRAGNVTSGRERIFVVGKRAAEWAADGRMYSRALQANTLHYVQITCGTATGTASFTTANIPLGSTYSDPAPPDTANLSYSASGRYAYPTVTGISDSIIDPQTGVLMRPLMGNPTERWYGWQVPALTDVRDLNTAWGVSEADLKTRLTAGNNPVPYAAAGSDPLAFVYNWTGELKIYYVAYVNVGVIGWGAGATSASRTISICLTLNGRACYGKTVDMILPATDPNPTVTWTGTTAAFLDDWREAGKPGPAADDLRARSSGTVSISGASVTATSAGAFSPLWVSGSRIAITGSGCAGGVCTIASVEDDMHLTLASSPGDISGATWNSHGFGYLVWKKTSSTDQINLRKVYANIWVGNQGDWTTAGSEPVCASVTSSYLGTAGYHCTTPLGRGFWWVNATTGDRRLLGSTRATTTGINVELSGGGLDILTDGVFYGLTTDSVSGKEVIISWHYTGDNSESLSYFGDGGGTIAAATTSILTPSPRDIKTLIGEFNPAFDARFVCGAFGVQDHLVILGCRRGVQDTGGWTAVFDPAKVDTASGCVGGGSPGCVIAATSTWTNGATSAGNPWKWCDIHYLFGQGGNGWTLMSNQYLNGTTSLCGGPYRVDMSGTLLNTATQITVSSEPYDPDPASGETGAPGEYGTVAVGDQICVSNSTDVSICHGQAAGTFETVKVTGKSGSAPNIVLDIQRAVEGSAQTWTTPVLTMHCAAWALKTWWDFANDPLGQNTSSTMRPDSGIDSHSDYLEGYYVDSTGSYYQARLGTPPTIIGGTMTRQPKVPTFASVGGPGAGDNVESHPNWSQTGATSAEKAWFLDMRTVRSSLGGSVTAKNGHLFTLTATLNRKILPTLAVCGTQPLRDISSATTGNVIATDATSTPYTYCVAANANECRTGSSPGQVFVNCPYNTSYSAISVSDNTFPLNNMIQIPTAADPRGSRQRKMTGMLGRFGVNDPITYWSARSFADASWALTIAPWVNQNRHTVMAMKMLPWPTEDSVNRETFVPVEVQIGSVPAGTDNIIAEFGYDPNFYCTSRQEACVAVGTGQVSGATPFYFASETYSGLACASGCTITMPALPQRVLYYRLKYRAADGTAVGAGQTSVTAVP